MSHSRFVSLAIGIVVVDQATKTLASGASGDAIVPVRNPDYSLGLISGPWVLLVFGSLVGILAVGGYTLARARRGLLPLWVPALLVGGGSANLLDRVVLRSVRDFLVTPWAVVNLADIAVLVGVIGWLALGHRADATPSRTPPARLARPDSLKSCDHERR